MAKTKLTRGLCILLTVTIMLGMIVGAGSSAAIQTGGEMQHYLRPPEPSASPREDENGLLIFETIFEDHYAEAVQAVQELFGYQLFEEDPVYEEPYISENRRNFLYLMESGYSNNLLIQRFRELFGDHYSGAYIFHNYRSIFGLYDDEVINDAFLRVISGYRVDFRFQNVEDYGRHAIDVFGLSPDDVTTDDNGRVLVFPDNEVVYEPFYEELPEWVIQNRLEFEFPEIIEDAALDIDVDVRMIQPFSAASVSISFVSRTDTSITVDVWFSSNHANTYVALRDYATMANRWIRGNGQPTPTNGRLTISGLAPGVTYGIEAGIWDFSAGRWVQQIIIITTTAPAQHLINHSRSSVDFSLDRLFLDVLGPAHSARFMDATNEAFYSMRTLTGGPQFYRGGRMQMHHTRSLPWFAEAVAGWPIRWQLTYDNSWLYSIDHAHRMRVTNADTTETPIHEIAHNFDSFRWSFELEAMAIFFTYYYYATTGRTMAVAGTPRMFRGGEFRTYMRSYANRALGFINHNEAMRQGVYSPYSMAYVLANIAGQIGWQPFTNTFIFFHNMEHHEVPRTNLERLNLFLTRLRHYSGNRDVISMIPANARGIFEQYFGGNIRYLNPPTQTAITNPALNAAPIPRQSFNVTWNAVADARYVISVRNVSTNALLTSNQQLNGTSFTIPLSWLVAGNQYRVAVGVVRAGQTAWSTRYFTVQNNMTVTFNANGGTPSPGSRTVAHGSTLGTLPAVTRTNHTFAGWWTAATGGTQIHATTPITANMNLVARWTANAVVEINSVTIRGTARVGSPLRVDTTLVGTVINPAFTYQWQRWSVGDPDWQNISGATNSFYIPTVVDEFVRVVVRGTGTNVSTTQRISDWVRVQRQLTGHQVIECFGRDGLADIFSGDISTTVQCRSSSNVQRPIWEFVHIEENVYAIRNYTTRRYLTESSSALLHLARASGSGTNYPNSQRWRVVIQNDDGSFLIRSVSNPSLYITETWPHISPSLILSPRNSGNNRQNWWIGPIWHSYRNFVAFWGGVINIQTRTLGTQPDGFDFTQRMTTARNAWGIPLGVTFNDVNNRARANIRAYGGDREMVRDEITWPTPLGAFYGMFLPPREGDFVESAGTIQAGGIYRPVFRFTGSGDTGLIITVFTGSTRNINFATMTAIHELGHALGYYGHSPNSNDVMAATPPLFSPPETLNPAELEHLRQIYRRFR